jgi:hypothetical protein
VAVRESPSASSTASSNPPEAGADGAAAVEGPAAAARAVVGGGGAAAAAVAGAASGRKLQPPIGTLSHSFVRVIQPGELTVPVVVDPSFREQFEIPHPTAR